MLRAAGILFITPKKSVLLCKRSGTGDHGGAWALPGGGIEDDESPDQAARREVKEELNYDYTGDLGYWTRRVKDGVDYITFRARIAEIFEPDLNDEHTDYQWVNYEKALYSDDIHLHPGARIVLQRLNMDELDVAKAIRDRELASPQPYENMWLFDLRITGTGASYRKGRKEFVWRDPSIYLNDHFVQRCNGLNVILEHPVNKPAMDVEEFRERNIGTIFLPYIRQEEEEVWGIAKIYDQSAAEIMLEDEVSTSPAVVFRDVTVNEYETLDNGAKMLIEGKPSLLDHLAVCELGVWDKGGEPTGVEISHRISDMAKENARMDADTAPIDKKEGEKLDMILSHLDSIHTALADTNARMDAYEAGRKDGEKEMEKEEGEPTPLVADRDAKDAKKDAKKDGEKPAFTQKKDGEKPAFLQKKDNRKDGDFKDAPPSTKGAAADADDDDESEEKVEDEPPEKGEEMKDGEDEKEDERMDSRHDSLSRRLDAVERRTRPLTDDQRSAYAEFQSKADKVFQAFQDHAPRALDGESLMGYKHRILSRLKKHSKAWKEVNIYGIKDKGMLAIAQDQILSEAYADALAPSSMPAGVVRPITEEDMTGRRITRFHGDPEAVWGMFKSQTRRLVGVNNHPDRR